MVPWQYHRHLIARRLGMKPWELDDVPHFEIEQELRMLDLEEAAKHPYSQGPQPIALTPEELEREREQTGELATVE